MNAKETVARFKSKIAAREPIIGAGAGTGLCAKCEDAAGADFIVVSSGEYFTMQGRSAYNRILPMCDANQTVLDLAPETLTAVKNAPVIAGVYANDSYRFIKRYLAQLKEMGFAGVQNTPSMAEFDEYAKKIHDSVGLVYDKEVEMVALAHELGLLCAPLCFSAEQAERMCGAGADVIIACVPSFAAAGGAQIQPLDRACAAFQQIRDAAAAKNPEIIALCHDAAIFTPEDFAYVIERTEGCDGYYGADSIEGIPVAEAIAKQIKAFKDIEY